MPVRRFRLIAVCACLVWLIAGCGADETGDTTEMVDETTTTTSTTTSSTTTTMATTTTTVALFDTLTDAQKEVVDDVCTGELFDVVTYLQVVSGESGVPALEDLFIELGDDATNDERAGAAQPICEEIGWGQMVEETTTTAAPEATADIGVVIGDLVVITGRIDGCPMDEILAGERWSTGGDVPMTDGEGSEWDGQLVVDATADPFVWSFSFSGGGSHRMLSVHGDIDGLGTPPMSSEIGAEIAEFTTVFNDSLASVSGGWPDTEGTVTITCTS